VKSKTLKSIPIVIATGVIAIVCTLQYLSRKPEQFGLLKSQEWMTYDWRAKRALNFQADTDNRLAGLFIDDSIIADMNNGIIRDLFKWELNDDSFDENYNWPWPRFIYGRLVRELGKQGALATAFDIFFSELDPYAKFITFPDENDESINSDEFFAREIAAAGNVILATEGRHMLPAPIFRNEALCLGSVFSPSDYGVKRRAEAFFDLTNRVWHPLIDQLAVPLGFDIQKPIFKDNSIFFKQTNGEEWRVPTKENGALNMEFFGEDEPEVALMPYTNRVERIWHMGIRLGAIALGLDLDKAVVEADKITLPGPNGLSRTIPINSERLFLIDWSMDWQSIKQANAVGIKWTLIQDRRRELGETDLEAEFKDKLVVIGSTGTGNNISDRGATPLEDNSMLVTKHFNVANSVIAGRFIKEYSYSQELMLILLLGIISACLTWRLKALHASLLVILTLLVYVLITVVLFVKFRMWIPIVLPVFGALLMTHVCMVTYRVVFEQKESRRVKSVFSKLVAPTVVNELLKAESLDFGGARRPITIFFSDVRGFTKMTDINQEIAEKYISDNQLTGKEAALTYDKQARETLETVNLFLATIANMVKKHNGTLDKYMGDCVMAFWGAPTPNKKHALNCVQAAIDSQRAMHKLNLERAQENEKRAQENERLAAAGKPPSPMLPLLSLGTGINSGVVTVGLMGSDEHILNYTVFGREVNVASRLEGVSGRGHIIIGETTFQEIQRYDPELAKTCLQKDPVTVKGIQKPVTIYEVPWK
jgi:class 3 adenylate cyclase/CHASE2 domain-containing sensor protein